MGGTTPLPPTKIVTSADYAKALDSGYTYDEIAAHNFSVQEEDTGIAQSPIGLTLNKPAFNLTDALNFAKSLAEPTVAMSSAPTPVVPAKSKISPLFIIGGVLAVVAGFIVYKKRVK